MKDEFVGKTQSKRRRSQQRPSALLIVEDRLGRGRGAPRGTTGVGTQKGEGKEIPKVERDE